MNKSGRIGSEWAARINKYLKPVFPRIRRTEKIEAHLADFVNTGPFVIEAKAEKTITLPKYLRQVSNAAEKVLAQKPPDSWVWPIVFIKRRNHPINKAYIVMEADTFSDMVYRMREKGLLDE